MGNCLSKVNKDYFFAFEEEMRNDTSFFKGKAGSDLEKAIRGKTYMVPFHKEVFKYNNVGSITNWGVVERTFLKRVDNKRYSMLS